MSTVSTYVLSRQVKSDNPKMDCLPDAVLAEVLSFLQQEAFLPICHVSKRFRDSWFDMKIVPRAFFENINEIQSKGDECNVFTRKFINGRVHRSSSPLCDCDGKEANEVYLSNPLQDGNLFDPIHDKSRQHQSLRTSLLEYYISCGWNSPSRLQLVLHAAAARGDIKGMKYLIERGMCCLEDKDICTTAGGAGQLDLLLWLREEKKFPWDAAKVFRKALENSHHLVMTYVYLNSEENDLQSTAVGMPW